MLSLSFGALEVTYFVGALPKKHNKLTLLFKAAKPAPPRSLNVLCFWSYRWWDHWKAQVWTEHGSWGLLNFGAGTHHAQHASEGSAETGVPQVSRGEKDQQDNPKSSRRNLKAQKKNKKTFFLPARTDSYRHTSTWMCSPDFFSSFTSKAFQTCLDKKRQINPLV